MSGRNKFFVIAVLLAFCGTARAEAERLQWDAWERMPVLHRGRIKPMDTFARVTVQSICGRESPTIMIDDRPRKFQPSELIFSWVIAPERWERVEFLAAGNEELRKDLLGLRVLDPEGNRLKYASPRDVLNSRKFHERREKIGQAQDKAEEEGKNLELTGTDKKVAELWMAYVTFRQISFDPAAPRERRGQLVRQLNGISETWQKLAPGLQRLSTPQGEKIEAAVKAGAAAIEQLFNAAAKEEMGDSVPLDQIEPLVVAVRRATEQLRDRIDEAAAQVLRDPPPWAQKQLDSLRIDLRGLTTRVAELVELSKEAHYALYDNGDMLTIVPALNPAALEKDRQSAEDKMRTRTTHAQIVAQPWLTLKAVVLGSNDLLREYPQDEIKEVRAALDEVKTIYLDGQTSEQSEDFPPAMERFVASVRALGEAIEPLREQLPLKERDEGLMAATAYPAADATSVEVAYNRLDPFTWTWILSMVGVGLIALAFGRLSTALYWTGLVAVVAGQVFTLYGLGMRVYVTGLAPVTNMFETVIYVAFVVAVLGLWFTFVPLFARGMAAAWRMTAFPADWEVGPTSDEQQAWFSPGTWRLANWALALPRLFLIYAVFTVLVLGPNYIAQPGAVASYVATSLSTWTEPSEAGYGYFSLVPRTAAGAGTTVNDIMTWAVGLCVLGLSLYYLPRAILAAALAPFTVPYTLVKQGLAKPLEQVMARKPFALAGGATAFFAAFLAVYVPTIDRNVFTPQINPLNPVLRDNFWLTSHVLTITASYGAGALAWGLGNIALGIYLFGRYRKEVHADVIEVDGHEHRPHIERNAKQAGHPHALYRHPPESCATLGHYMYKATQVAVLLLAAGTILGALWADVAWGRFWGWDSKEVWALISLLIYLAVLHGRYAGWFGNFGLAVGTVIGATAILMAWYGVNFVLGTGLHAYGTGAGGKGWVFLFIFLNWLYATAAAARYHFVTRLQPWLESRA